MKNIVGNVWEWTEDWWQVYHDLSDNINPVSYIFAKFKLFHFLNISIFEERGKSWKRKSQKRRFFYVHFDVLS